MQALEDECEQLRQAATESAAELAEERRRGVSKERKLMDRSHEAAKLREQLQDAESKHQVQRVAHLSHESLSAKQGQHLLSVWVSIMVADQ